MDPTQQPTTPQPLGAPPTEPQASTQPMPEATLPVSSPAPVMPDTPATGPSVITPGGDSAPTPTTPAEPVILGGGGPGAITPTVSAGSASSAGKGKLIVIISIIVVLLLAAVSAFFVFGKKSGSNNTSGSNTTNTSGAGSGNEEEQKQKANALTAESVSDYGEVCSGSTISNAAPATNPAPHVIALFEESKVVENSYSTSSVTLTDKTWRADYKDFAPIQLVGCIKKKSETNTGKTCKLQDSSKKELTLPQYSVVYELTVFEAKTGKKLGAKDVSGPATSCPMFATYNPNDPKLYGEPDDGSATEAVKEFVTK